MSDFLASLPQFGVAAACCLLNTELRDRTTVLERFGVVSSVFWVYPDKHTQLPSFRELLFPVLIYIV